MRKVNLQLLGCVILFIFITASCGKPDKLEGKWLEQGDMATQIFDFREGGQGYWLFQTGMKIDTFPITYTVNYDQTPNRLDIHGFKNGPLAGKALYGLIEFTSDGEFKYDSDPGPEGDPGDKYRPKSFTSGCPVFKKQ